jgi:fatty acid desaturase
MSHSLVFNRFRFNQLVFGLSCIVLCVSFTFLIRSPLQIFSFCLLPINALCLHYLLNITHIASHNQMSKNFLVNQIIGNISATFGGLTMADFSSTHLIHHLHPADKDNDPDYPITKLSKGGTNFISIPFKIWMHDTYFWTHGLWKKRYNWLSYILNRTIQIAIVIAFNMSGILNIWMWFWLLPILVVGFFNGMFLFYFPHFTTKWENTQRARPDSIFHSWAVELIDISRIYHEFHHNNITENRNYYPLENYIWQKISGKWETSLDNFKGKYIHV